MKNTLLKVALVACLSFPLLASAKATTTIYTGGTATDSTTFSLASLSSVSIGYTWSDMYLSNSNAITKKYDASSLGWLLTGASTSSGSFADAPGALSGSGTLSLGTLAAGTYTLTLTGVWADESLTGNGNANLRNTAGTVNLFDGDKISGNRYEANSLKITAIPAVPEPETYAMLMAGLGLMGFVARRRRVR